ncbi:MAG TPA: helix-turn-helix domain-containing protein [Xanthomonadales bacterium]|nr:helix-turn-helix domain-containing protein [Xanthomonadales bacterium]
MQQQHFESLYPDTARQIDIEKIISYIKEGSSCQLLSIPGAGRSTVFRILANNKKVRLKHLGELQAKTHFVLVNFSEIRKRPLFDAMKFLFLSVADSLRERGMNTEYEKVNGLFRDSLKLGDELVLFQALKQAIDYLSLTRKMNIVMLFDRFEEYIPTVTSEFFTNLRALRTRAKYQFSVIFSLNRPLESLLDPTQLSDYYEFVEGHEVYLTLSDDVTTEFRVKYIEKITDKKLHGELLGQIIKETGGVGKLVKLSVEALLSDMSSPRKRGSMDSHFSSKGGLAHGNDKNLLGEYLFSQKQIKEALSEICRSLTPSEQVTLIRQNYDNKEAVEYLECIAILSKNKIQIPLFEQHIRTHMSDFKSSPKKIIYDGDKNIIKMGEVVLSDQLTSAEFKLLSFLLQSTERIVTRDEIIGVVWSEVKSTAGITDQAVDQLIFRVRRKIEEDPNSPQHLLTVKGRGFKFIP